MTNKGISQAAATAQVKKTETEVYISFGRMEWAALRQTCLRSQRLYAELKWLANFKTGVVGTFGQQKLSYEGLAQMVAIPVRQGTSASHATVDGTEIRRLLERLESLGLVADLLHDGTRLTMTLPMSPIRASKAKAVPTKTAKQQPSAQAANRGVDSFLLDYFEQEKASAGSDNRWQDAGRYGEKLPTVAQKLPIVEHPESAENPHEDWGFDDLDTSPSVLAFNTDQYLSVPDSVRETGEAFASPSTGGACDTHAPQPPHSERPLLEGGGSAERTMGELEIELALKALPSHVSYMGTADSRQFIRDMESLGVEQWEIEQAVQRVLADAGTSLTPSAILRELKAGKVMRRQRNSRGLGGRVSL